MSEAYEQIRNTLKNIVDNANAVSMSREDFLSTCVDLTPSLLDEAIKAGYVISEGSHIQPCTEMDLKRLAAVETPQEGTPEETETQTTQDPVLYDGPGEYYQLIHENLGMCLVRTEAARGEWHSMVDQDNMVYFKDFWFLHDEAPLVKYMRDNQGREHHVSISRLRFYRAHRGARFPMSKITFENMLTREDTLVQNVMRFPEKVVEIKQLGEEVPQR